jgi:uncharacterized protein with von Willebrand factor type A (vWA) domain
VQSRQCYVYAFSGPGDVMELELGTDQSSVTRLLSFLKMSFNGGTDVDAPLALSLERLNREGWELVSYTESLIVCLLLSRVGLKSSFALAWA